MPVPRIVWEEPRVGGFRRETVGNMESTLRVLPVSRLVFRCKSPIDLCHTETARLGPLGADAQSSSSPAIVGVGNLTGVGIGETGFESNSVRSSRRFLANLPSVDAVTETHSVDAEDGSSEGGGRGRLGRRLMGRGGPDGPDMGVER